jgi:hypothetical protein
MRYFTQFVFQEFQQRWLDGERFSSLSLFTVHAFICSPARVAFAYVFTCSCVHVFTRSHVHVFMCSFFQLFVC